MGTGIEWAVWNNWSVKAEYDYFDFGTRTVAVNGTILPSVLPTGASFGMQDTTHVNQFKAGLNWHIRSGLLCSSDIGDFDNGHARAPNAGARTASVQFEAIR